MIFLKNINLTRTSEKEDEAATKIYYGEYFAWCISSLENYAAQKQVMVRFRYSPPSFVLGTNRRYVRGDVVRDVYNGQQVWLSVIGYSTSDRYYICAIGNNIIK